MLLMVIYYNCLRQPLLCSFVSDKPASFIFFSEPETIHYKKINISILTTITFYPQNIDRGEVNFDGKTLNFTLQWIKI